MSNDAQESADRQSQRVQPDDPYTEPDNAVTNEWFGQSAARDAELAEQVDDEAEFDAEATGAEEQAERHDQA
jgi:hypothetical protein